MEAYACNPGVEAYSCNCRVKRLGQQDREFWASLGCILKWCLLGRGREGQKEGEREDKSIIVQLYLILF